eukprot:156749-Prymnesium_polylepis.1
MMRHECGGCASRPDAHLYRCRPGATDAVASPVRVVVDEGASTHRAASTERVFVALNDTDAVASPVRVAVRRRSSRRASRGSATPRHTCAPTIADGV